MFFWSEYSHRLAIWVCLDASLVCLCLQGRLTGLTSEFNSTAQSANRLLGSLMNRGKGTTSSSVAPEALEGVAQEISAAASQQAQRRSDVPPSLRKRSDLPASLQKAREQQEELTEAASQAVASSRGRAGTPPRAPKAAQEAAQPTRAEPDQGRFKRKMSRKAPEKNEAVIEAELESTQGAFEPRVKRN